MKDMTVGEALKLLDLPTSKVNPVKWCAIAEALRLRAKRIRQRNPRSGFALRLDISACLFECIASEAAKSKAPDSLRSRRLTTKAS